MCRMMLAVGDVDAQSLIRSMKKIASDRGSKHEFHRTFPQGTFVHYDGWGASWYRAKKWEHYHSVTPIFAEDTTQKLPALSPQIFLLHVRRKSIGNRSEKNCQPFFATVNKKEYVFSHNGHITKPLIYDPSFVAHSKTDSERLFYTILSYPSFQKDPIGTIAKTVWNCMQAKGNNFILSCKEWSIVAIAPSAYKN